MGRCVICHELVRQMPWPIPDDDVIWRSKLEVWTDQLLYCAACFEELPDA